MINVGLRPVSQVAEQYTNPILGENMQKTEFCVWVLILMTMVMNWMQ